MHGERFLSSKENHDGNARRASGPSEGPKILPYANWHPPEDASPCRNGTWRDDEDTLDLTTTSSAQARKAYYCKQCTSTRSTECDGSLRMGSSYHTPATAIRSDSALILREGALFTAALVPAADVECRQPTISMKEGSERIGE